MTGVSPEDVVKFDKPTDGFLCGFEDNIFNIEFTAFCIRVRILFISRIYLLHLIVFANLDLRHCKTMYPLRLSMWSQCHVSLSIRDSGFLAPHAPLNSKPSQHINEESGISTTLFDVAKEAQDDGGATNGHEAPPDDSCRRIKYHFGPEFLDFKTIGIRFWILRQLVWRPVQDRNFNFNFWILGSDSNPISPPVENYR